MKSSQSLLLAATLLSPALRAQTSTVVADIHDMRLPFSSRPRGFTEFSGRHYFVADDSTHGAELWSTDGSAAGTRLFKDTTPAARAGAAAT